MSKPALAAVDPVDGTLYVIYEDGEIWAYRPPAGERLQEGWRRVEGGPVPDGQVTPVPSSRPNRSASSSL